MTSSLLTSIKGSALPPKGLHSFPSENGSKNEKESYLPRKFSLAIKLLG